MGLGPHCQFAIIFYPGNPACSAGKVSQNRRVVAGAGSDMHNVVADCGGRAMDQVRVQRRLAVVDPPLGQDADQIIGVEVDGIGSRGRHVFPKPTKNGRWARTQEIFAANLREMPPRDDHR